MVFPATGEKRIVEVALSPMGENAFSFERKNSRITFSRVMRLLVFTGTVNKSLPEVFYKKLRISYNGLRVRCAR